MPLLKESQSDVEVDFVIVLRAKTPLSRTYLSTFRGKSCRIYGQSFIVGLGLWRHCWKPLVPRLHLAGQFLVKGFVTDFSIGCDCIREVLIQWPNHARIIYPVVGRESDNSLEVSHELLGKTVYLSSIGKDSGLANELVNVSLFMDCERFHVLHLGEL